MIQWSEELYERILIERTKDACHGEVDVVIDFGTTSRSLNRSIQCLSKGGVVFLGHETADRLLPKFSRKADEYGITIQSVETGSLEQLKELVDLVHSGKVNCRLLSSLTILPGVLKMCFDVTHTGEAASAQRLSS